jgi:hypothetical protein
VHRPSNLALSLLDEAPLVRGRTAVDALRAQLDLLGDEQCVPKVSPRGCRRGKAGSRLQPCLFCYSKRFGVVITERGHREQRTVRLRLNVNERNNSLACNVTTSGAPQDSVRGALHDHGSPGPPGQAKRSSTERWTSVSPAAMR